MKKITEALAFFLALLLTACAHYDAPNPGHTYTDPINATVGSAKQHLAKAMPVIDASAQNGTLPKDVKLTQAGKEVHAADKVLDAVPGYVTKVNTVIDKAATTIKKQNTVISKQAHRIAVDDAIVGGIMLCVMSWAFLEFGLPLLKLIPI